MFQDVKAIALAATGVRKLLLIIGGVLMTMGIATMLDGGSVWPIVLGFLLVAGLLGAEYYATRKLANNTVQSLAGVTPQTDTIWEQVLMVIGSMLATFGVLDAQTWALASGSIITLITLVRDFIKTGKLA